MLLLEKGLPLPRDGSTLDAEAVLKRGLFLSNEPWVDGQGRTTVPEEHFNLGGKTKWYGAALLRFGAHEFEAERAHQCLSWPISYRDLAPFYDEAERLLDLHQFPIEPNLQAIAAGLARKDPLWRTKPMPIGLARDILDHRREAQHFDGFASTGGFKSDAEQCLLSRLRNKPNLAIETGQAVKALIPSQQTPTRIAGVLCEDGSHFEANSVFLACGALHSPRLLQTYLESMGLHNRLASYQQVGRNYKAHLLSLVVVFSWRPVTDLLCKTALLLNETFPHSSVQAIGGNLAEEIVRAQVPGFVPHWLSGLAARRAYGLFLQTEDGSHPDNRIVAKASGSGLPQIDYDRGALARSCHGARAIARDPRPATHFPRLPAGGKGDSDHRHRARVRDPRDGTRSRHLRGRCIRKSARPRQLLRRRRQRAAALEPGKPGAHYLRLGAARRKPSRNRGRIP